MDQHIHQIFEQGDITMDSIDGDLTSIGIKGLFGAKTFFGPDGDRFGHSEHNTLGGKDLWVGEHLVSKTMPTQDGHLDLLHPEHSVHFDHFGNTTTAMTADGHQYLGSDMGHGFYTVMEFSDPLLHISEYLMPYLPL